MHIPDGFLSAPVSVACGALSATAVAVAAARSRALLGSRAVALMGVTAAFVFAAQMLTFPVAGGTSGHLVGGVLAAVLLGPSAAVIVMTAVLALQCLVFGDGGLLSLGANVLNMAIVQPVVGFAIYRLVAGRASSAAGLAAPRRLAAVAFASWVATVVAAGTCAGELALSRAAPPAVLFVAMTGIHLAIGLGEGIVGALVVATVMRLRPELVDSRDPMSRRSAGSLAALGLIAALGLALFLSPFACSWPDGLEHVVQRLGVQPSHVRISLAAPLRDYAVPGVSSAFFTTSLAAGAGTVLAFGICWVIGAWLAPRRASGS